MAIRQFTDSTGVNWEVFDVQRHTERRESVSSPLRDGWLTFVSKSKKLRLPGYPEGWWSLTDAALEQLCGRAIAAHTPAYPAGFNPGDTVEMLAGLSNEAVETRQSVGPLEPELIRQLARTARAAGTPAVQAMIELKRFLAPYGIDAGSPEFRGARRVFVDSFYFD